MKAWILEKQSNIDEKPLKLADVPLPVPDKQEVRIKVLACGICRTDIHIAEGDLALKKSPLRRSGRHFLALQHLREMRILPARKG